MKKKLKQAIKNFIPQGIIKLGWLIWNFLVKLFSFPNFFVEYYKFYKLSKNQRKDFVPKFANIMPILNEATANTGFDHHYIYHPAWAARIVKQINPEFHTDIGSLLHFPAILSAFIKVKYYDYRPAHLELSNLESGQADLINLPFKDNSIKSLSCMHVVEHIGLGRYGDKLDPTGDIKAIKELQRVVATEGSLLFAVPLGQAKVCFNGHRIYSYNQICEYFKNMQLVEFTLITDYEGDPDLIINANQQQANRQVYGCGCFWFKKK